MRTDQTFTLGEILAVLGEDYELPGVDQELREAHPLIDEALDAIDRDREKLARAFTHLANPRVRELRREIAEAYRLGRDPQRQLCELCIDRGGVMLFWNDSDVRALGVVLGENFTEGQLDVLADLLDEAGRCLRRSPQLRAPLRQLAESIREGERLGRVDHYE